MVERGTNAIDPESDQNGVFGYQEGFSPEMLKEMYGNLEHYKALAEEDTMIQVSKGFVCREDAGELIRFAVDMARKRGLE